MGDLVFTRTGYILHPTPKGRSEDRDVSDEITNSITVAMSAITEIVGACDGWH